MWREVIWAELRDHPSWPLLSPELLREVGLYGGAAGIWLDKSKTSQISQSGVAVSVLHTGKHYDDDVDEDGIIYHYPTTRRHPSFDANEIESVKQAGILQIPIFVILKKGKYREVRRAWVSDFDDVNRLFLIEFGVKQPQFLQIEIDLPFQANRDGH